MTGLLKPYPQILEAFRNGGGVDYSEYDADWWDGLERSTCVRYRNFLVSQWLPEMPDVAEKLAQGGRFADFGCGAGGSTIELAKPFPDATFFGFDLYAPNIDKARVNAEAEGVGDRVTIEVADLAKQPHASYDVVSTFDVIHDMADPMAVVQLGASIHFCMTTSLARAAWVWVPSVCRKARSRNLPGKLVSPPCADCRSNIPSTYSTKSAPDFEVFS